ncbi:hypothetical protein Q0N30_21135 [Priestia megaterium]|uniref:hypothetical protein n=1 Tax=Priestia megaterium TaxID=1404 RepID=UPI00345A622E
MLDEQKKQQILSTLQTKGALTPCRRCENNEYSVEGYFHQHIQEDVKNTVLGQEMKLVPTVGLVCTNCGQIDMIAVGAVLPAGSI